MFVAGEPRNMTGSDYAVAAGSPAELTFTSGDGWRQRRNLVARLAAWRDKDSGKAMVEKILSTEIE
jgi:hypothetical protein